MNKTFRLDYRPLLGSRPTKFGPSNYKDLISISVNGVVVESFDLSSVITGYSVEKPIVLNANGTNTIVINLQQILGDDVSEITGTTEFSPVKDSLWRVSNTYDWRQVSDDKIKQIDNILKIDHEGFLFKVNDIVINQVDKLEAGALYSNSIMNNWDTINPLVFTYEEFGVTTKNQKFVTSFSYQIK